MLFTIGFRVYTSFAGGTRSSGGSVQFLRLGRLGYGGSKVTHIFGLALRSNCLDSLFLKPLSNNF